ncbi:MAG: YfhO family protein [Saccharofermentans sp.]|nr:YfhO family protein [Saccharofermentans sp.]
MGKSLKDRYRLKGFIYYTVMFAVLFAVCFFVWILKARVSPISRSDGLEQHFISYIMTGRILREGFTEFFNTGHLHFQQYITSYGLGEEYLICTDPFYLLSMFVPERFAEYGFSVMVVAKCYLTGIAFLCFVMHRKRPLWACLAGAAVYTFCGSMYLLFHESSCVEFMYTLPFIMLGTVKLWEEGKHGIFVAALTFGFFAQYYFTYMACLTVLIYCIVRFIVEFKDKKITIREGFIKAGKYALCAVSAAGMAAVAYVPILARIVTSERMGAEYEIGLLYPSDYYQGFFTGFTSFYNMLGRDCYVGFAAMAVPLIALMFLDKGHKVIKTGFILATAGLLTPFFGHIMNGMSYPSNRWVWVYDLCVCVIFTDMLVRLKDIPKKKKLIALAISCLYSFLVIFINFVHYTDFYKPLYYSTAILTVISALAICTGDMPKFKKIYPAIMASVLCLCITVPAIITFTPSLEIDLLSRNIARKTALHKIYEGGLGPVDARYDLGDGERVESYNLYKVRNATSVNEVNSFDMYYNLCNSNVEAMFRQLAIHKQPWNGGIRHLDERTELDALFGVNHVFVKYNDTVSVPYGYDNRGMSFKVDTDLVTDYTPDQTFSIAYFMDKSISYEDYMSLDPEQRQQVLLQAVVLKDGRATGSLSDLSIDDDELEYDVIETSDLTISDDLTIEVTANGGYMVLDIPEVNNCQIYTYFEGLDFVRADDEGEAELFVITRDAEDETVTAENLYFLNGNLHMYSGIKDWIVNSNSITEPVDKIVIAFTYPGTYTLTDLKVYARSFESIDSNIARLNIAAMPDEILFDKTTDSYTMNIDAPGDRYLMLSIPYTQSWKAYIDGEETEVYQSATGLMAIEVPYGRHDIKLTASIFALKESAIVTLAFVTVYTAVNMILLKSKRKLLKLV